MKIHKEGYPSLLLGLTVVAVFNYAIYHYLGEYMIVRVLAYLLSFAFFGLLLNFFRNPPRNAIRNANHIVSPADGKVVVIEETFEAEYFKDKRLQISVFMSPLNVHANRCPIDGKVLLMKYHKGKYLVAFHPKSSTENERTSMVIEGKGITLLMRQIAGALARRIVYYTKEGQDVKQGEEMGFIKFGSRVDLYLPIGTKVTCKIGDIVKGSESVLAQIS